MPGPVANSAPEGAAFCLELVLRPFPERPGVVVSAEVSAEMLRDSQGALDTEGTEGHEIHGVRGEAEPLGGKGRGDGKDRYQD